METPNITEIISQQKHYDFDLLRNLGPRNEWKLPTITAYGKLILPAVIQPEIYKATDDTGKPQSSWYWNPLTGEVRTPFYWRPGKPNKNAPLTTEITEVDSNLPADPTETEQPAKKRKRGDNYKGSL